MPTLMADLATWLDIDTIAWGQRYAVVTACRLLYTLVTAEVASKTGALEWAMRTSTRPGGRCWGRYVTTGRSASTSTPARGPAQRRRRGSSRRTP